MANSSFSQSQALLEHSKLVSKIKLMQPGMVLDTNLIIGTHRHQRLVTLTALGKAGERR